MKIKATLLCILLLLCITGCSGGTRPEPIHRFESFTSNTLDPVSSRISLPPDIVLHYLRNLDARPDYSGYMPTQDEKQKLEKTVSMLPGLNRSILKKRLLGIYFIPNFMGSGLTEWVVDRNGTVYAFMVLNTSVLRLGLSELLTAKERTCFINDDPSYSVRINAGSDCSGLLYILLHESVHLVDYVHHLTPYVDDTINEYQRRRITRTSFTEGIWKAYSQPLNDLSFTGKVSFYGITKPRLRLTGSLRTYHDLSGSPFVSLYGSQSWAEDLAEMESFYHITEILKQPYIILILKGSRVLLSVRPMDSPFVKRRLPAMNYFYNHEEP